MEGTQVSQVNAIVARLWSANANRDLATNDFGDDYRALKPGIEDLAMQIARRELPVTIAPFHPAACTKAIFAA